MTKSDKPYHHGDLKTALLVEAERILEAEGIQALTLRAAARGVGVSHTAPQNHFGDLTGLLSDLAADGHHRLGAVLGAAAAETIDGARPRLRAMGRAYIAFARAHPGLFTLMFRSERLDSSRPALRDAIAASRQALRDAVVEAAGATDLAPKAVAARGVAVWSLVHGYTMLMLEGRLKGTLTALPDETAESLFEAVLAAVSLS